MFAPSKSVIKMHTEIFYVLMLGKLDVIQTDRGQTCLHVVNVICTDLDSFALTLHLLSQCCIVFQCDCSFWEAAVGSSSDAKIAVSSTNVDIVVSMLVGRSAVNSRYNNGPRTLLLGTPAWIGKRFVC